LSLTVRRRSTASLTAGFDEEGFARAEARPRSQDALDMLRWMKAGHSLDIRLLHPYQEGRQVMEASLDGFTAAYGKMMDECGFSIELPPR